MTRTRISARDRRALAWGGALIVLSVSLSRGVPAWRAWGDRARLRASTMAAELANARAKLGTQRRLADTLRARAHRYVALAPALVGGDTPAEAGATLAGLLSGAAMTSGVRLGALQIRTDTVPGMTFRRVTVQADATGDVRGITRMLATIERGPMLLVVREFAIDQPDAGAPTDRVELLRAHMTVEGLMIERHHEERRP